MNARWPDSDKKWCLSCGAVHGWLVVNCCAKPRIFHRDVQIHGDVEIGEGVSICGPAEVNGTKSKVTLGDHCDIAAHTVINVADSHLKCIGLSEEISRKPIVLENDVFVGSHAVILGGTTIGHHSVIGAGVILANEEIPPYSKVVMGLMPNGWKLIPMIHPYYYTPRTQA